MCCPLHHPIARQLTWLSSQQESPAALCRASVCRWDLALRGPDGFLVINSVCSILTFGQNLRILPLPFVLLYGTRRTSSPLSYLVDGRISWPVSCALCKKNHFAWHISALPQGIIFFHKKPGVYLSQALYKSVSRATSPGESLGDLLFLFSCQPPALILFPTPS